MCAACENPPLGVSVNWACTMPSCARARGWSSDGCACLAAPASFNPLMTCLVLQTPPLPPPPTTTNGLLLPLHPPTPSTHLPQIPHPICSRPQFTTMFNKVVVVDGRDHMLGRLASLVAKELLLGQQVVVVRCDEAVVSGSLMRNKMSK